MHRSTRYRTKRAENRSGGGTLFRLFSAGIERHTTTKPHTGQGWGTHYHPGWWGNSNPSKVSADDSMIF